MRSLAVSFGLLVSGVVLHAQDLVPTAAAITESWRGMDRVFDLVLPPSEGDAAYDRTLMILLDASPSLAKSGFTDSLAKALAKHSTALARTKIGVSRVGVERPLLAPVDDRQAVLVAVKQALEAPVDKIQNVFSDLRGVLTTLRGRQGTKVVLLATLDNGDAEDELDATVVQLESAQVKVHVLTTEAYVADSYWAARQYEKAPRGTKLVGGDAPHIDMPWGWLFQITVANEVTPSGFAAYSLNRVAAGTGGKVFLYAPPDSSGHRCSIYGGCLFCSADHVVDAETFWTNRVQPLAASTKTRASAAVELGVDPFFRATSNAWRAANQAGLLRSQPPRLGATGGSSGAPGGDRSGLLFATSFDRNAERAEASIKECEKIQAALDAELSHLEPTKGAPRERAIAEFTRLMLQITKVNLITFAGWCREIAPTWVAKEPPAVQPPEMAPVDRDQRPVGIGYTNYALCHGARPFLDVELPGGPRLREELTRLDTMIGKYAASYDQTPFIVALHRQCIARFHLTYPGVYTNLDRDRPKSKSAPDPTTLTGGRPARGGATGSGGGATGPTTGGGK